MTAGELPLKVRVVPGFATGRQGRALVMVHVDAGALARTATSFREPIVVPWIDWTTIDRRIHLHPSCILRRIRTQAINLTRIIREGVDFASSTA